MPSPGAAIWRIAIKNWPEIVKNGPKLVVAFGVLSKFLQDHPDIPAWLRQRLSDIPSRVISVQKKHGDAARIRGNLDIVRDVARDAEKADAGAFVAAPYVARADGIDRAVRLAEALARHEQRAALDQLKKRTDALLADLIEAVARVDPGTSPSPSPSPEQAVSEEQPPV